MRLMHFENNFLGIQSQGSRELVFDYVPRGAIHEIALGRDARSSSNDGDGYRARLLAFKSRKAAPDAPLKFTGLHVFLLATRPMLRRVHPSAEIELTLRRPLKPASRDLGACTILVAVYKISRSRLNLFRGAFECIFDLLKFAKNKH